MGDDGKKYTRMFFSNISTWGPRAERFLDQFRGSRYHVVGLLETHLDARAYSNLAGRFAAWGRRPFAAHAVATGRSESGTSGGALLCPSLALQLSDSNDVQEGSWKVKGKDWHMIGVRARHCTYLVVIAYLDHTIGINGANIVKLQQIQRALLHFKLPFFIFADWNCVPQTLADSGFLEVIGAEIKVAPGITETCVSGNIIDYIVVARSITSAISLFQDSSHSPWRAHKGFEVDIIRSPREIHILAVVKPKAYNLHEMVGKEERPDWEDIAYVEKSDNNDEVDAYSELLRPLLGAATDDAVEVGLEYRTFAGKLERYLEAATGTTRNPGMHSERGWFPRFQLRPLEHWSDDTTLGHHGAAASAWAAAENRLIELHRARTRSLSSIYIDRIHVQIAEASTVLFKIGDEEFHHQKCDRLYFIDQMAIGKWLSEDKLKMLIGFAHRRCTAEGRAHQAHVSAAVRAWATKAVEGSAKAGHAFLRKADEQGDARTFMEDVDGHTIFYDPVKSVAIRKQLWEPIWTRDKDSTENIATQLRELRHMALTDPDKPDAIEDEQVDIHIRKLRNGRGLGLDWIAPLEAKAMPRAGRRELACNLRHAEEVVAMPIQALLNLMSFMRKSSGGERTIALQATWVVLWSSIRGGVAKQFDTARARFWDSAISGASALEAGLMRRLIEELAVLSGMSSLSIFWDLMKFYDSISLAILVGMVKQFGYSPLVAALDLQAHVGLRVLRWSGCCSGPIAPCTSVLAGSKFSNAYARLYLYDVLETLHSRFNGVTVGAHVDDVATVACGQPEELLDTMAQLSEVFSQHIKKLKLTISPKTVVVSSSKDLANKLGVRMTDLGIQHTQARIARDLGIDAAGGKVRSVVVQKSRLLKAKRRTAKLKVLSKMGAKATKLYATNIWPSASYGSLGMGMAPGHIKKLRSQAGQAALGRVGQCSTTAIAVAFRAHSDPAIRARLDIILQWLKLWGRCSEERKEAIQRIWAKQLRLLQGRMKWCSVHGPIRAVIATLVDIGWMPVTANCWRGSLEFDVVDGEPLWWKFTGVGDYRELIDAIARSAMIGHWRVAACHMDGAGMEDGVDLTALKKHLKHYQGIGADDRHAALTTIASGACWPRVRKKEADLLPSAQRVRCGHHSEDTAHFFWNCPCNRSIDHVDVSSTQHWAGRASNSEFKCLWHRGLPPKKLYPSIPLPSDEPEIYTIGSAAQYGSNTMYFLDGSGGEHSADTRLRRCGWGTVTIDFSDPTCPVVESGRYGPLPGLSQSVPRAEVYAAVYAIENCDSEVITLISDNQYFVDTSAKSFKHVQCAANADLWERYFDAKAIKKEVTVIKVKSHGSCEDVTSGAIPWRHYVGNAYADILANEGAERAAVPYAVVAEVKSLDALAWAIQSRLVEIVCAGTTRDADRRDAASYKAAKKAAADNTADPDPIPHVAEPDLEDALGVPEIPTRLGLARSSNIHMSHRVNDGDGFIWCERCGSFATSRGRNLLVECLGFPTATGRKNLDRIRRGLPPHNSGL